LNLKDNKKAGQRGIPRSGLFCHNALLFILSRSVSFEIGLFVALCAPYLAIIIFDKNTDAKGRGSDLTLATQISPIRTRADLGAVLFSLSPESKNLKIARLHGFLKAPETRLL